MDFLFPLALLAGLSLNYIIHFQKEALPAKAKVMDGAGSNMLYVDTDNTIHRMEFTETTMIQIDAIPVSFDVERFELVNRNEKKYGDTYYHGSGKHDLFIMNLINSTHDFTYFSNPE